MQRRTSPSSDGSPRSNYQSQVISVVARLLLPSSMASPTAGFSRRSVLAVLVVSLALAILLPYSQTPLDIDNSGWAGWRKPLHGLARLFRPVFALVGGILSFLTNGPASVSDCKCFPGDSCWPAPAVWRSFNESLAGRLVATVPLAQPCHHPNYDEEKCSRLKGEWFGPDVQ